MKLLIVGGLSTDAEDVKSLDLLRDYMGNVTAGGEVLATNLDMLIYRLSEGRFEVYDPINKLDISQVQGLFIRGPKMRILSAHAYYLSQACLYNGVKFANSYQAYYPGTKFSQSILFLNQGLPFLETLYCVNKQLLVNFAADTFGYPFILKTNVGSHGDSNHLVHNAQEAQQILANEPNVDFLAQQYCPNNRDYRVLLIGDKDLIFERRGDSSSHINNVSKGGIAALAEKDLPAEIITQAKQLAKSLNLSIAGVDIMPHLDSGKLYFLEINSQPQLRTGALLSQKQQLVQDFFKELMSD